MTAYTVVTGEPFPVPGTDVVVMYCGPDNPLLINRVGAGGGRPPRILVVGTELVYGATEVVDAQPVGPCEVTLKIEPDESANRFLATGLLTVDVERTFRTVPGCVFCEIVTGHRSAQIVEEHRDVVVFLPTDPVVNGHVLVVPKIHVGDAVEDPVVTGVVMRRAAEFAHRFGAVNILTSVGKSATQSVMHLHVHVIPREQGDGLMVPWGTTGDPHAPHRCLGMDELTEEVERLRKAVRPLAPPWPFVGGTSG